MIGKLRSVFGSVAAKIFMIVFALAGTTAAAILVSNSLINTMTDEVDSMVEEALPPLRSNADVSNAVARLKDTVASLLMVGDLELLAQRESAVTNALAKLKEEAKGLDQSKEVMLFMTLDALDTHISELLAARQEELKAEVENTAALQAMNDQAKALTSAFEGAVTTASFQLVLAGQDAASETREELETLMAHEVEAMRLVLSANAELNLLLGYTMALLAATDPALKSYLKEQLGEGYIRVEDILFAMEDNKITRRRVLEIEEAFLDLSGYSALSQSLLSIRAQNLLTLSDDLDAMMTQVVTDIYNGAQKKGQNAVLKNGEVIDSLLGEDVQSILQLAKTDSAAKLLMFKIIQGGTAENADQILLLKGDLIGLAFELEKKLEGLPVGLTNKVKEILVHADPDTGLLANRLSALEARTFGQNAATKVTDDLFFISSRLSTVSADALKDISAAGQVLTTTAHGASKTMHTIGWAAAVVLLIAPVLTYTMIMRPLLAVTRRTEKLAVGDMAEIEAVGGRHGEIARLFSALSVFRNNLVEKEQMEEEARAQAKRDAAAKEEAAREEAARQKTELERLHAEEERERAREAKAAEEKRALEKAAEAERQARQAEQTAVVDALARGLRQLSQGDVRFTINETFPDSYEQLRQDFNSAVTSLRQVVEQLSESSTTIQGNSGEISNAADDLSKRTEHAASTLGQTAAALTELTASVKSAADGAALADQTVRGARANAESASEVVAEAIAAMDGISASSEKISQIISVIDDIAFQTNLLALNAGVEAARAGESGRGFAVVASEVRALAQRSSEAAREINQLISESGEEVTRGVSLVDRTGEALRSIVGEVAEIAGHMSEIATSAEEQSAGISEINTAVAQLDQTTQQNAAMFEETTAASFSLASEATNLSEIVAQFVVSGEVMDDATWPGSEPAEEDILDEDARAAS